MLIDDGTEGLSEKVIGVGIEVHRKFGPGLLERAYHLPMLWALEKRGFKVEFERPLAVEYEGKIIPRAYIIDLVVEEKLLIEIKSVSTIEPIHLAQVRTYLKPLRNPCRPDHELQRTSAPARYQAHPPSRLPQSVRRAFLSVFDLNVPSALTFLRPSNLRAATRSPFVLRRSFDPFAVLRLLRVKRQA